MAAEKEVEPSIPVSDTISFEVGIPSQEDTETPTIEPTIPIFGEGLDPIIKGPLVRQSLALEIAATVSSFSF